MSKPSVFIGSSTEGLPFARAVRSLLDNDAEVQLWNEGFFVLGKTFIETLVNALPRFDFAVLVFTPDDIINSRQTETLSPRDNVIFEAGLFMGRLGRLRTIILHQSNAEVKIPTDLAGLTTASYEWPRKDNNHKAAIGRACDSIREVLQSLGKIKKKTDKAISEIKSRQEVQETALSRQQAQIRSLQVALQGILTKYEYEKLDGLARPDAFLCYYSEDLLNEMKRLRAMGLVKNKDGVGLRTIRERYRNNREQFDLKEFFYVSEDGKEYLMLRNEMAE